MPETVPTFAARVREADCGNARAFLLPTPVDRVVSFGASFRTLPDFGAGEELEQKLAVMMLDRGTRHRDRFAVAEALEDRGAQVRFYDAGTRCGVGGRVLRDDLPDVLALVAEQLREPLFDPGEFEKVKARHAASLRRSLDNTGIRAGGALVRRLYPADHPNYEPDPIAELERLATLSIDDVRAFHERHFGARDLLLAFAGDFDPAVLEAVVRDTLGGWPAPTAGADFATEAAPQEPGRAEIVLADRQNLDVRLGHAVGVRRDDDEYLPLYVGTYIFGGNFSARLMSTVRDEQGLTYGIRSSLAGVAVEHGGHWKTAVTLSGDKLERGIEATLEQARRFVEDGITEAELDEKKTTIAGSYKVGLATTGGLATALLANAERGFDVGYLDRFPALIEAVTRDEVNVAVRRHLDPERLHVVVAGTLPEASVN